MPLEIIRNDITKMKVDAIVNASNIKLKKGGGVSGAIFAAAGENKLQQECDKIGECNVGEAVITSGYNLPAKYVIHTVGPIWKDGHRNEEKLLHNCYSNSLELAALNEFNSIAFPLISSGVYGFPKEKAFHIAVTAISEFLITHEMAVYLVVYDKKAIAISEKLFVNIKQYIDDNYVEDHAFLASTRCIEVYENVHHNKALFGYKEIKNRKLNGLVLQIDETFSQMLLRLIDEKGYKDVEIYKKANVDRKLFSKIRSNPDYNPKKTTALAFAISLELNLDETLDLLGKAGYTLSHSNRFDLVVEFFIKKQNYNIFEINEALFAFEQNLLGV
jgi:O-acetyl-ADP-ribose deacetylase (regulator of RNase III)